MLLRLDREDPLPQPDGAILEQGPVLSPLVLLELIEVAAEVLVGYALLLGLLFGVLQTSRLAVLTCVLIFPLTIQLRRSDLLLGDLSFGELQLLTRPLGATLAQVDAAHLDLLGEELRL